MIVKMCKIFYWKKYVGGIKNKTILDKINIKILKVLKNKNHKKNLMKKIYKNKLHKKIHHKKKIKLINLT